MGLFSRFSSAGSARHDANPNRLQRHQKAHNGLTFDRLNNVAPLAPGIKIYFVDHEVLPEAEDMEAEGIDAAAGVSDVAS
jgi:hypothetical protein